jgi:hypothetical protein
MRQPRFKRLDRLDDVKALPRTAWAGDDVHAAGAQAQRFEDVIADLDLFDRIGGQRDANGVADPGPEESPYRSSFSPPPVRKPPLR